MKRAYIAPQTDIIRCEHLCETIPVHFSQPGTGVVDSPRDDFDLEEEFDHRLVDDMAADDSLSTHLTHRPHNSWRNRWNE